MDSHQFCYWGKRMVDYICEYQRGLPERRVIPEVEPGYLRPLLPDEAPEDGETWNQIFEDLDKYIIPGLTHWQHPSFYAYFPAANSVPSVMADMLAAATGCIGFSWAASPAITELEIIMLDWLAKLLHLPPEFTHESGKGGGVIQSSASDSLLVCMLAARHHAIQRHKHIFQEKGDPNPETAVLSRLVAYGSNLAHSCVEKASVICFVKFRQLDVDKDYGVRGDVLQAAMEEDIKAGLIPFFVCATLGTTACCSFDDLANIGPVCDNFNVWLHVDAAYAGNAFICPEFRHYLKGIEHAWSMNVNPNKWLLVGFDCSLMWVRDHRILTSSLVVNPVYLQHKHSSKAVDFRHWGIPLSRRFRALKLWFVLRIYGANGLREYIRRHVQLAQHFAELVQSDNRFQLVGKSVMGLVCFRLKGSNTLNQHLTRALNESLQLHLVPAVVEDVYFMRFAICRETCTIEDVNRAWQVIQQISGEVLKAQDALDQWQRYILGKTGTDTMLNGMDEMNTSSGSDEENNDYWEKALVHDQADEQLIDLVKQRLHELRDAGATDAFSLLLSYLQKSGWSLEELELDDETDSVEEASMEKKSTTATADDSAEKLHDEVENNVPLLDVEDSGKYSIPTREASPEPNTQPTIQNGKRTGTRKSNVGHVDRNGTKGVVQDSANNSRSKLRSKNPLRRFSHDQKLIEPDDEFILPKDQSMHGPISPEQLLADGKTSSPIVKKLRAFPCYAAPTLMNESKIRANAISKDASRSESKGVKEVSKENTSPSSLHSSNQMGNFSPVCLNTRNISNNQSCDSVTSKSFDRSMMHSYSSVQRLTASSCSATGSEAYVCDRDLGVGTVHDRTLEKIHRKVLRKMISEPVPGHNQSISLGDSVRPRKTRPRITSFIDEILLPTQLALNASITRTKCSASQPATTCHSIVGSDDAMNSQKSENAKVKDAVGTQCHTSISDQTSTMLVKDKARQN